MDGLNAILAIPITSTLPYNREGIPPAGEAMFAQTTLKARILGILAMLAFGYLVLLVAVQITSTSTHSRMSEISASLFPAALKMQEAEAAFERMKKHYGDVVVLQDQSALAGAEKDAEAANAALAEVKSRVANIPGLGKQAEAIQTQFSSIRSRDHELYAAILKSAGVPTDDQMAEVGQLGKENKALTDAMSAVDKSISVDFQKGLDTVDANSVRSSVVGYIMLVFAILSCAVAYWVVQNKVVAPLHALAMYMHDIAEGEGDLTLRIAVNGKNEIDEVGTWFNVFIERIETIVRRVAGHAATLGTAAAELANNARATADQATQQQHQAERITATMQEMSSAVHEISQTTQTAAIDARKAEESAKSGGETVQSTVETIGQLLHSNQETSAKIEELGRSSDAIGKIINVIDEIAAQTNLLALNASIEAARAGEHGRGFAVVAGEVRRLAERTSSATKEIDATVRAIQEGTAEAVEAMRSSMSHVQDGVDSARSAGSALTSIIHGSESVQQMVTQIATAATEQSYSTQSVSQSVTEIAAIIQQTADSSQHSVQACQKLSSLANELSGLVNEFKVGRG